MPKPYVDAAKVSQFSIMAKIKIWPHEEICPNGADIESLPDETICEAALRNNIKLNMHVKCHAYNLSLHCKKRI